jgi:hypothetical protein
LTSINGLNETKSTLIFPFCKLSTAKTGLHEESQ